MNQIRDRLLRRLREIVRARGYDIVRHYGPPERIARCHIVSAEVDGTPIRFLVADEHDHIQREHLRGRFYEPEELAIIGRHFNRGGVFLDVGANVGNHSLYAATILNAARVIAIEPNPPAYRLLRVNAALNGVSDRILHHAVGLSDTPGRAVARQPLGNLGGTSLTHAADGDIELVRGDDLVNGQAVNFVKIDTEAMELTVLRGLTETLARARPMLFVEVDDANAAAFAAFLGAQGYRWDPLESTCRHASLSIL